jgi:CRP-like cAMP-binding protein
MNTQSMHMLVLAPHRSTLFMKALEFCERSLIRRVTNHVPHGKFSMLRIPSSGSESQRVESLIKNILGKDLNLGDDSLIDEIGEYCEQKKYMAGQSIFKTNTHSDAFYIVVSGRVAVLKTLGSTKIISGAGVKRGRNLSSSNLMEFTAEGDEKQEQTTAVESFHNVGNVFGFCDFLLERSRTFDAVAKDGTILAKFTRAHMERMKVENPPLHVIIQNMLLKASLLDLANCTCHA